MHLVADEAVAPTVKRRMGLVYEALLKYVGETTRFMTVTTCSHQNLYSWFLSSTVSWPTTV